MLRSTVARLARPKGPLGAPPGGKYAEQMPFRTELAMIRACRKPQLHGNMQNMYNRPMRYGSVKAVPRDLGELPRTLVVKELLALQPVRMIDLFAAIKRRDDAPVDSQRHLRQVLNVARRHRWVAVEKNQANNLWYFSVHPARAAAVQDLVRADAVAKQQREREEEARREELAAAAARETAARLDAAIIAAQSALLNNIAKVREFDPNFVASLPYVTESGAVNVAKPAELPPK